MSRLVIELNRSLHHKGLFSRFSQALSEAEKTKLIQQDYLPYRNKVQQKIATLIQAGHTVLHLSVHSFTPELDGEKRNADIGLLYDPSRALEKPFCQIWKQVLNQLMPDWTVRLNYPYLGKADGFTTYLRKQFAEEKYLGIELETNQALWLHTSQRQQAQSRTALEKSLQQSLLQFKL
jgi:predicted N-formylglutamate amidohydrolase